MHGLPRRYYVRVGLVRVERGRCEQNDMCTRNRKFFTQRLPIALKLVIATQARAVLHLDPDDEVRATAGSPKLKLDVYDSSSGPPLYHDA